MTILTKRPFIVITPFILVAIVAQGVIPRVSSVHQDVAHVLTFVSILCWTVVLLIWASVFGRHLIERRGKTVLAWWHGLWSHVSRVTWRKKAPGVVSVAQLSQLRDQLEQFGLALYGTTPEWEKVRRTHHQLRGEAVPDLVLPQQNAVLFAECSGMIKMLTHYGFPKVEGVRLSEREYEFFLQWKKDLETRLHALQNDSKDQHLAVQASLAALKQLHHFIGETYPVARVDSGYLRLQGAIQLLEKLAQESCSPSSELIYRFSLRLHQDLQTLQQSLQKKVV